MPIKSRPVYAGLQLDGKAKRHVMVADDQGAEAVLRLLAPAGTHLHQTVTLLLVAAGTGSEAEASLRRLQTDVFMVSPTIPAAMFRLDAVLSKATMGTRIYVAGTEGLIGQTVALAQRHGVKPVSVEQEHCGSSRRRVQCVHCKGITEDVATQIVQCAHCGVPLFVRDHFSRRLGAFMGVSADAEEPGVLPENEEVFR